MNDPQVVALTYRIIHSDAIDYGEAAPLALEESRFLLTVEGEKVRFQFNENELYASEEQAREAVAEYIRVWEFDATLRRDNPDVFRLEFEKAEIVDRNPTPGHVELNCGEEISIGESVRLTLSVGEYPAPPADLVLTPDVETMYRRYMGYRKGREPLASMANFCLTVLEDSTGKRSGKRKAAAERYRIGNRVLNNIGTLSEKRGGSEARKAKGIGKDFNSQERQFLEQAVKTIVRRMAERGHSSSDQLRKICMSDLPSLKDEPDIASKPAK